MFLEMEMESIWELIRSVGMGGGREGHVYG